MGFIELAFHDIIIKNLNLEIILNAFNKIVISFNFILFSFLKETEQEIFCVLYLSNFASRMVSFIKKVISSADSDLPTRYY